MKAWKWLSWVIWIGIMGLSQAGYSQAAQALEYRSEGMKLQQEGNDKQALIYFQKAARSDRDFPVPYNDIGVIYEKQGRFEEAKQAYLRAIEIDPTYPAAYTNLALLTEGMGQFSQAIYYWKKRMLLEPEGSSRWKKMAANKIKVLEKRIGGFKATEKYRDPGKRISKSKRKSKNPIINWLKGRKEQKSRAEKLLGEEWLLSNEKGVLPEQVGSRYYQKGVKAYHSKKYNQAYEYFSLAKSYGIQSPECDQYLANSKLRKDEVTMKGILSVSEKPGQMIDVSKEDKETARDFFRLGLDYYKVGDYDRAFSQFSQALTYNPYDITIKDYVKKCDLKNHQAKIDMDHPIIEDIKSSQDQRYREELDYRLKQELQQTGNGFAIQEDLSVTGLINKAQSWSQGQRYNDAIQVLKQARILDVDNEYDQEIVEKIQLYQQEKNKMMDKIYSKQANLDVSDQMTNITKASIPSKEGAPDWSYVQPSFDLEKEPKVTQEQKDIMEIEQVLDKKYTVQFDHADLSRVMQVLLNMTGLNIILDTGSLEANQNKQQNQKEQGKDYSLTMSMTEMPLREILDTVLRLTNYVWWRKGRVIWVTSKEKMLEQDIEVRVYDVSDLVGTIKDFPGESLNQSSFRKENQSLRR